MTESTPITVTPQRHPDNALFMREVWANGEGPEGEKVEVSHNVLGGSLIMQITYPDGTRIVETLGVNALVTPWANAISESRKAAADV